MKNADTTLETILGFCTGISVFMLFVSDIWSGTAGSLAIAGAFSAAIPPLSAGIMRSALEIIPEPIPVRGRTSSRNRSSGLNKFG